MGLKRQPIPPRFWAKVQRPLQGCWPWLAARNKRGYGVLGRRDRGTRLAHRIAWELTRGPIPAGLEVCHHCDNPSCVRPTHLFVGTQSDNIGDAQTKGRLVTPVNGPGESARHRTLRAKDVILIRALRARGFRLQPLAERFGVRFSQISKICRGTSWKVLR